MKLIILSAFLSGIVIGAIGKWFFLRGAAIIAAIVLWYDERKNEQAQISKTLKKFHSDTGSGESLDHTKTWL